MFRQVRDGRAEERQETKEQRTEVKGEGDGEGERGAWDQVSRGKGKGRAGKPWWRREDGPAGEQEDQEARVVLSKRKSDRVDLLLQTPSWLSFLSESRPKSPLWLTRPCLFW